MKLTLQLESGVLICNFVLDFLPFVADCMDS
jgi:hypothetical protein